MPGSCCAIAPGLRRLPLLSTTTASLTSRSTSSSCASPRATWASAGQHHRRCLIPRGDVLPAGRARVHIAQDQLAGNKRPPPPHVEAKLADERVLGLGERQRFRAISRFAGYGSVG